MLFIRSNIQISHWNPHYWSTQLNAMSLSTSMIQSYVTFEAKLQSTPTSKSYLCIAHPFSVMNTEIELTPNHNQSQSHPILILSHSILIIIIMDGINIEYTSLNGLESKALNVLFSSFLFFQYKTVHLHGMQSSHIQPIFIQ